MIKYNLWICIVIFFLLPAPLQGEMLDRVVAVVNGDIVTLHELNKRMQDRRMSEDGLEMSREQEGEKERVLESMINDILMRQEADRLGITVSEFEVENSMEQMLDSRGISRERFQDMLQSRGMDLQEYKSRTKKQLKKNKLLTSMVRQKVVVTEQEIEEYYNEHEEKYLESKKCSICVIMMQDKDRLQEVLQRIDKGEISFARAVEKFSRGPATDNGGCLGTLKWNEMREDWKKVIRDMEAGEVSRIVSLENGYGAFMLESELSKEKTPLQEVRDEIRDKIYSEKLQERYKEYVEDLRSDAVVQVKL
ncbi:MAG: SurA N-terminal domain-containing protein [Thermodesulfobacteriota bacterium]